MKIRARDGTCRRREEEKARRERKWKKDMLVLEGILELKMANEVAEFAGQFFECIELGSECAIPTGVLIDMNEAEGIAPSISGDLPVDLATDFQSPLFLGANHVGPLYEPE